MVNQTEQKPIYSKYENIVCINIDGKDLKNAKVIADINKQVEAKVKSIVDDLKTSHNKFIDKDFGPLTVDDNAEMSLYYGKIPAPSGSKYPRPEDLRWDRPIYEDNHFAEEDENTDSEGNGESKSVDESVDDGLEDEDWNEKALKMTDTADEVWCKHGSLFIDGAASGDVIQGQLGDCWFLGALAVMGANENLLQDCFWKGDTLKNYGLFVVRFIKGVNLIYVIIDDRIPVKRKDGKIIFAACKDPNELWVPLLEKAYAKLHGCYKALIGGYSHFALSDMTGYCPKLVTLKPGFPGYSDALNADEVWQLLERYKSWGCLMGTSIQSNPKDDRKVESEAGMGLHMGHAYSFLGTGTIEDKNAPGGQVKLVRLRNPWGRGEWEGEYGDRTDEREREDIQREIEKYFKSGHEDIAVNFMDGAFFMPFDAWLARFTSLFVAIKFPDSWMGKRTQGYWTGECGGNREMGSWISNPKFKFKLNSQEDGKEEYRRVFVGLSTQDTRLTLGADYYLDPLYATPLCFDIVVAADFDKPANQRAYISCSSKDQPDTVTPVKPVLQAAYNYGSTQVECFLKTGQEYYIVPFLSKRGQAGAYNITVYADANFDLEGGAKVSGESSLMVVGEKVGEAVAAAFVDNSNSTDKKPAPHWNAPQAVLEPASALQAQKVTSIDASVESKAVSEPSQAKVLSVSKAQFYEKAEQIRARFISEAKRLNVTLAQIKGLFASDREINGDMKRATYAAFKRRLMDVGFSLTDLPDEDLVVLDIDNSGSISPAEFIEFFEKGLSFEEDENMPPPPPPPVDDLLFKAADLEGVLRVKVFEGRAMRQPAAWFSDISKEQLPNARSILQYNSNAQKLAYMNILNVANVTLINQTAAQKSMKVTEIDADIDEEDDGDASPVKPSPNSPLKRGTSVAGISAVSASGTNRRINESAVQESGIKLHNDKDLIEAEIHRARMLQDLRKAVLSDGPNTTAAELEKTGVLRKREKTKEKIDKRDLLNDTASLMLLNKKTELVIAILNKTDDVPVMRYAYERLGKACPIPPLVPNPTPHSNMYYNAKQRILSRTMSTQTANQDILLRESLGDCQDIWDVLIERVVTICDSRIGARGNAGKGISLQAALYDLKTRKGGLDKDVFIPFMAREDSTSMTPTPKIAPEKPAKKGTTPTPRTTKKIPGWASVTTAQSKANAMSASGNVAQAMSRLGELQKGQFFEIYRRVVSIPVINEADVEGVRTKQSTDDVTSGTYLSAFAKRLFSRFDKNLNGLISLEEFKESLLQMNINVSEEDSITLFNRFETRVKDGTIDWNEFLDFFRTHIVSDAEANWDAETGAASNAAVRTRRSIVELLLDIHAKLAPVVQEMAINGWMTIDEYFMKTAVGRRRSMVSSSHTLGKSKSASSLGREKLHQIPENCIFHHLNSAHASRNATVLRQLQIYIDLEDMKRVNRAFGRNVSAFMVFISSPKSAMLDQVMKEVHKRTISGFEARVGVCAEGDLGNSINSDSITKLWNILCPNKTALRFEEMVALIQDSVLKSAELDESLRGHSDSKISFLRAVTEAIKIDKNADEPVMEALSATRPLPASSERDEDDDDADESKTWVSTTFMSIHAELIARCAADFIAQSAWNKATEQTDYLDEEQAKKSKSAISYSAFEAYVRCGHVTAIETKLKYLLQLEMSIAGPRTYALVHVFLNFEQTELIVLVHEPLSGDVSVMNLKEDFSSLPNSQRLEELCRMKCQELGKSPDVWAKNRVFVYTPQETPAEDQALSNIVSRLRIVRTAGTRNPNLLVLSEDPRFVAQLRSLLDAATDMPFFCTCSETTLYFEVDVNSLDTFGEGLKPMVFGAIRGNTPLHSFLTTTMSNLNVVLSTYNSGIRIALSWREMLAHLTDYRNAFLTAELRPRFLEPNEYVYKPFENSAAWNGEAEMDPLAVQRSPAIMDGGTHPHFNANFAIKFRPPKLTACKLLSTEIHKMTIDGQTKFVILMLREAKRVLATGQARLRSENESFMFLTIYDPRSATDYQCGVKAGCHLYKVLIEAENDELSPFFNSPAKISLDRMMAMVSEAAEKDMILLGPAITPRLLLTVINQRGHAMEVLGQCQLSISSVLSGSGVGKPTWNTLTYLQDDGHGKDIPTIAGEIQVELGFRKLQELQDELKAEKLRVERKKSGRMSLGTPQTKDKSLFTKSIPKIVESPIVIADVEPPPPPANTPAMGISPKSKMLPRDLERSTNILTESVTESDVPALTAAIAAAEARAQASLEKAELLAQETHNQNEKVRLLEEQLLNKEANLQAKEDEVRRRDALIEEKETALREALAKAAAAGIAAEKNNVPKLPIASSSTDKSPRSVSANKEKNGKESKMPAIQKGAASSTAVPALSPAELTELQELRALKEKLAADAAANEEALAKRDKELKKMAEKLKKQKEAAAIEKAALEEQLAKETAENEKLHAQTVATGTARHASKNLSASTPVTLKERVASAKQLHGDVPDDESMAVYGSGYPTTSTGLAQTAALDNISTMPSYKTSQSTANIVIPGSQSSSSARTSSPTPGAGSSSVRDWSTIPLPNGWEVRTDEKTGRPFYIDHINKKTQWKHPSYVRERDGSPLRK